MNEQDEVNPIDPALYETNNSPLYQQKRDDEEIIMNAFVCSKEYAYKYVSDLDEYKIRRIEKERERLRLILKEMKETIPNTQLKDEEWKNLALYCLRYGSNRFEFGKLEATDYSDCHVFNYSNGR
jgi:hypothetical protein